MAQDPMKMSPLVGTLLPLFIPVYIEAWKHICPNQINLMAHSKWSDARNSRIYTKEEK